MKKLICVFLCLLLLGGCSLKPKTPVKSASPSPSPTITPTPTPEPSTGNSTTTGLNTTGPYKPVAIMIENSPDARPQSGLSQADVVYEAYVEGSITRFMAIFSDNSPKKVGPLRSSRIYYVDLQQEWDALYTHFGGPQMVYDKFKQVGMKQRIDGMTGNTAIWRDNQRKAPHNAYADIEKLKAQYKYDPATRPFKFTLKSQYTGTQVSDIKIPYNKGFNIVDYQYDTSSKSYSRSINDKPFMDKETGKQVSVKNVIIEYAKQTSFNDSAGHINIDLIGSGKAEMLINGYKIEGTWSKKSITDKTIFYDPNNKEIELQPGNTWIQIVPINMQISYK